MGRNVICLESSAPWPRCEPSGVTWERLEGEPPALSLLQEGLGNPDMLGSVQSTTSFASHVFKLLYRWWQGWLRAAPS